MKESLEHCIPGLEDHYFGNLDLALNQISEDDVKNEDVLNFIKKLNEMEKFLDDKDRPKELYDTYNEWFDKNAERLKKLKIVKAGITQIEGVRMMKKKSNNIQEKGCEWMREFEIPSRSNRLNDY